MQIPCWSFFGQHFRQAQRESFLLSGEERAVKGLVGMFKALALQGVMYGEE